MVGKVNFKAIAVYYVIAVLLRYLATKTTVFSFLTHEYLQILIRGIGPAAGGM